MTRLSPLTAFHGHILGLLTNRTRTSSRARLDFIAGVIFAVLFSSFIVRCVPVSEAAAPSGGDPLSPGWLSWKYPNPRTDPDRCGWTDIVTWAGDNIRNISWICDPDHILGYHEAYNLALLVDRFHRDSQCDCPLNCSHGGYRIAVALVGRINTEGEFELMKMKAKAFAQDLRVTWFQDHGCDDNVLIFYSYYDDELYVSLGEMAEHVISDIELVRLNNIGDEALRGKQVVTSAPSSPDGALQVNSSATTVPPTTTNFGLRRTPTYAGLETLAYAVHAAIANGPSISSGVVYAAAVPVLLVLMIFTMCLLANWCCRPAYDYQEPAQKAGKEKEDEEEEEEGEEKKGEEEEEREEEKVGEV